MVITINDEWRLVSDSNEWALQRRTFNEEKSEWGRWKRLKFGSLEHLLKRCVDMQILSWPLEAPQQSIDPILDALDELRADIKAACAQVREL